MGTQLPYYFEKVMSKDAKFNDVIELVTSELKKEGFGVLTEINVNATLKKKLDVDFRKYRILGACNPDFAHKALLCEPQVGILLPCNFVVQERLEDSVVVVSGVNPLSAMSCVPNPELEAVATDVETKIKRVLANL